MGIAWVPLTIRGSHYWGSLKIPLILIKELMLKAKGIAVIPVPGVSY